MNDYLKKRMEQILAGRPLAEKKKYTIPKVSKKRAEKAAQEKERSGDTELDLFFAAMRPRLTGKCLFCNAPTQKKDDVLYRWNIAHLLPKRPVKKGGFPSVATCEENWVELCTFGNDCHGRFDRGHISWELIKDSKEWEIILEKLLVVLPLVAEEERKHRLYGRLIKLVYG